MGKIHSIETLGALDGPGIRVIVYLQGCPLRCAYCHNPDTWEFSQGEEISVDELVGKILRYKHYFSINGGVTFSGGEPLMQGEFLLECLKKCKENGINTALDTSGVGTGNYAEILEYVDLVILDIKHENSRIYKEITGIEMDKYNEFKEAVIKAKQKVWLKHVVVPNLTDSHEHICGLKNEIFSFNNIEKIELLPYHTMGISKYEQMGIPYPLEGYEEMTQEEVNKLQEKIMSCELEENNKDENTSN